MHAPTAPHRPRPAAGLVALRRLGVLLVLLGVLAMHTVAGGSHMAMAGPVPAAAPPGASAVVGRPSGMDPMPGSAAHAGAASRAGSISGEDPGAAAVAAAGVTSAMGVGLACVAVLLGILLMSSRTAAGTAKPASAPSPRSADHGSAPLGRGPPRQLLAQICVLRT